VFIIKEVKQVKNFFILKFENFTTDKDVVPLVGKQLFVDDESLFKLPPGHYYIHDLIGSSVFQGNVKLGVIKEVLQLPANDVYVLENQEGVEVLIPAVKKFIDKFDVKKKNVFLTADFEVSEDDED
jgi:16S rRNA processing protein RimM